MHFTREGWEIGGLAVGASLLAVVLARPLLFVVTVLLGAYLLTQGVRFIDDAVRVRESLAVTQTLETTTLRPGEDTTVTVTATRDDGSNVSVRIEAQPPPGAVVADPLAVTVDSDTATGTASTTVSWPIAGYHEFEATHTTLENDHFSATVSTGPTVSVTVEPAIDHYRSTGGRDVDVQSMGGNHAGGAAGGGIEFEEIRQYVPGEPASNIDWKATARLPETYVREFDAETTVRTALVVDHRESLGVGSPGATKLDYLRGFALDVVSNARQLNDPLRLVTVGTHGITAQYPFQSTSSGYGAIRNRLLELEATTAQSPTTAQDTTSPTTASLDGRQLLARLEGASDAFSRTIRPYVADGAVYHQRIESQPLYETVRLVLADQSDSPRVVIVTDDSNPAALKETVRLARSRGSHVTIAIAPTVLYDAADESDMRDAYQQYVAFESLRRQLSSIAGVTALEVGPGDRVESILASSGQYPSRGRTRTQRKSTSRDESTRTEPAGRREHEGHI